MNAILKLFPNTKLAPNCDPELVKQLFEAAELTVIDGKNAKMYLMRQGQCHTNAQLLDFQGEVDMTTHGVGLSPDGLWREHSWGVFNDVIVETTVERIAYVPFSMKLAKVIEDQPTAELNVIDKMTAAVCIVCNHMGGNVLVHRITADTASEAQDKIAAKLPVCARPHVKRRTRNQNNFISLVYPQDGTELIIVYVQMPLKKVVDTYCGAEVFGKQIGDNYTMVSQEIIYASVETLANKAREMLDRYMLYDYSFVSEVLLNPAYSFGLKNENYQVVKNGTIMVSGKEFARYYMPSLPALPEFFHESLSKLVAFLRGTLDSGDTVTLTRTELNQFMIKTGTEFAQAMASGELRCCGCKGH